MAAGMLLKQMLQRGIGNRMGRSEMMEAGGRAPLTGPTRSGPRGPANVRDNPNAPTQDQLDDYAGRKLMPTDGDSVMESPFVDMSNEQLLEVQEDLMKEITARKMYFGMGQE